MLISKAFSCAICHKPISAEEKAFHAHTESTIQHLFHQVCILPWLEKKEPCPICQKSLITEKDIEVLDLDFCGDEQEDFFVTIERINAALLFGGDIFLSRVIRETPYDRIVQLKKESAQEGLWSVQKFLIPHCRSEIAALSD